MTIATDQAVYYRFLTDPKIVTVRTNRHLTGETLDQITWLDGSTVKGGASRMSLSRTRSAFGGGVQLVGNEQTWNIPDALLVNANGIEPGDLIIEDLKNDVNSESVTWVVGNVTRDAFETQWICVCVKGRME